MTAMTDRVGAVLLASDANSRATIAAGVTTFQQRLDSLAELDWRTGRASIDEPGVKAAVKDLQRQTSSVLGAGFADELLATLRGGFAVLDADRHDAIPWKTLVDPRTLSRLPAVRLEALGVTDGAGGRLLRKLRARYPGIPAEVNAAVAANLARALRDSRALQRGSGMNPPSAHAPVDGVTMSTDLSTAVTDFVDYCLPASQPHWPTFSTGFGIELSRDCSLNLADILRIGGAPILSAAGLAAIGAGSVTAALAAAVSAVGGWVTLIVAVCAVVFSGWLDLVVTDAGACIHFPWWAGFGPVPYGL